MAYQIDISRFAAISEIDCGDEEETALLKRQAAEADHFIRSFKWCPPVEGIYLAFGIPKIFALFLVRFERPVAGHQDQELWIVVGDLPTAYFVIDDAFVPSEAAEAYCELMEGWAKAVLAKGDLSKVYPVAAAPTDQHAEMLLGRIEFIRENMIPIADERPFLVSEPDDPEATSA